ncbi:VIT1/CCC1 transporter family protein [Candidatus Dojkabacteria bacterium]|uniref:VIT1/CCC1 transporter family protein n=1 Tax=Candidatus Dojkabacteria bacterium TaxID=2099670 RepID=A0A955RIH7_9BACT|nr:VIT1/CCC1 transporter family protein [Candidatus Dojkabacteria bacterium]
MSTNLSEKNTAKTYKISPISEYLREITYGGTDGIVTTFAVVAGYTGASLGGNAAAFSFVAVLLFGLANLFADASSMGLGNFLSIRSEKEVYKKEKNKERHEIRTNQINEKEETINILMNKGFSQDDAEKLASIYKNNEEYWVEFMMNYELEMSNPEGTNPFLTGFITFISFIIFGFLPLIPYLVLDSIELAFTLSAIGAALALAMLGIIRWRATNESLLKAVMETLVLGSVSAIIAFLVGSFFN